jgi:hypothetical protein
MRSLIILVGLGFIMAAYNNCSPMVTVPVPGEIVSTDSTKTGNPLAPTTIVATAEYKDSLVLTICMSRLELTRTGGRSRTSLGITPTWVVITPFGSDLGKIAVPPDDYSVFELEANNDCGAAFGVQLINDHGTFKTSSEIDMFFDGRMIVAKGDITPPLVLNFENFIFRLSKVKSGSELRDAFLFERGQFYLSGQTLAGGP